MTMDAAGALGLNRIAFWQGQMLGASDFRSLIGTGEQLRWWHNRSLHDTYGVRFGLEVAPVVGLDVVAVSCGVGYDCTGRELVIRVPLRIALPALKDKDTAPRVLVLSVRANPPRQSCCEAAHEPCWPPAKSKVESEACLSWLVERDFAPHAGVPLARFIPGGENPIDPGFIAPSTRPLARPHVASGATIPGNTPWEVWFEDFSDAEGAVHRRALGMQTHLDTSAGGFTTVPRYFAQLEGPLWDGNTREFLPAFFPSIANATVTGFTFRLLMRGLPRRVVEFNRRAVIVQDVSHGEGQFVLSVKNAGLLKKGMTLIRLSSRPRPHVADAGDSSALRVVAVDGNKITLQGTAERLKPGDRLVLAAPRLTQQVVEFEPQAQVRPGEEIAIIDRGVPAAVAMVAGLDARSGVAVLDFARSERALPLGAGERLSAFALFNTDFSAYFTAFARRQELHVCWIGCQCRPAPLDGCVPPVDPEPCDRQE
jgi:hypothetical protein